MSVGGWVGGWGEERLTVCVCVSRILSCLMEHLYTDKMVEDCELRLLELQYFIARDWK